MRQTITVREYESLELKGDSLKRGIEWINKTQDDSKLQPLRIHQGGIKAQNYVGILALGDNVNDPIIEILPKLPLIEGDIEEEKKIFFQMLKHWRSNKSYELNEADIEKYKKFPMWEVFIHLFLKQTLELVKRGIVSQYQTREDNLPYLKGRLLFPQHAVINATNKAQFYVQYDQHSPNHAANRLIVKALQKISCKDKKDQRLRRQLINHFDGISHSLNVHHDWQEYTRHRADRTMRHYEKTMQWVELFLFGYGLVTYQGKHHNKALVFPMQEVFEDFVTHHFRQCAKNLTVHSQSPEKKMVTQQDNNEEIFTMKPDITLCDKSKTPIYILDTKWKRTDKNDDKYGISQGDMYQLYSYGKLYNCERVALIYPKNENFEKSIHFTFNDVCEDDAKLKISCYPFDVAKPEESTKNILKDITQEN